MTKQKPELILLIDDSEDDNYIHKRAIGKSGLPCQIDTCTNGEEAIDYLINRSKCTSSDADPAMPDLIFLDINMPRVNGWEFLDLYADWINDDEANKHLTESPVVIVMLSTSINPADEERAAESALVSDYVSKPMKPDMFTEIVGTYFPQAFD